MENQTNKNKLLLILIGVMIFALIGLVIVACNLSDPLP